MSTFTGLCSNIAHNNITLNSLKEVLESNPGFLNKDESTIGNGAVTLLNACLENGTQEGEQMFSWLLHEKAADPAIMNARSTDMMSSGLTTKIMHKKTMIYNMLNLANNKLKEAKKSRANLAFLAFYYDHGELLKELIDDEDIGLETTLSKRDDGFFLGLAGQLSTSTGLMIMEDTRFSKFLNHGNEYDLMRLCTALLKSPNNFALFTKFVEKCATCNRLDIISAGMHSMESRDKNLVLAALANVADKTQQEYKSAYSLVLQTVKLLPYAFLYPSCADQKSVITDFLTAKSQAIFIALSPMVLQASDPLFPSEMSRMQAYFQSLQTFHTIFGDDAAKILAFQKSPEHDEMARRFASLSPVEKGQLVATYNLDEEGIKSVIKATGIKNISRIDCHPLNLITMPEPATLLPHYNPDDHRNLIIKHYDSGALPEHLPKNNNVITELKALLAAKSSIAKKPGDGDGDDADKTKDIITFLKNLNDSGVGFIRNAMTPESITQYAQAIKALRTREVRVIGREVDLSNPILQQRYTEITGYELPKVFYKSSYAELVASPLEAKTDKKELQGLEKFIHKIKKACKACVYYFNGGKTYKLEGTSTPPYSLIVSEDSFKAIAKYLEELKSDSPPQIGSGLEKQLRNVLQLADNIQITKDHWSRITPMGMLNMLLNSKEPTIFAESIAIEMQTDISTPYHISTQLSVYYEGSKPFIEMLQKICEIGIAEVNKPNSLFTDREKILQRLPREDQMVFEQMIDKLGKDMEHWPKTTGELLLKMGCRKRWTEREFAMLGDIGWSIPVTCYDDGNRVRKEAQSHSTPIKTTAFVGNGILVAAHGDLDFQNVMKKDTSGNPLLNERRKTMIDEVKYKALVKTRLLPLLIAIDEQAAKDRTRGIVTMAGLGTGQFAVLFDQTDTNINKLFADSVQEVVNELEKAGKLSHIDLIRLDIFKDDHETQAVTHTTDQNNKLQVVLSSAKRDQKGQPLSKPQAFGHLRSNILKIANETHRVYTVVAGDHVSWPGNDWYEGSSKTNEGTIATATNMCSVVTGKAGHWDTRAQSAEGGKFRPKDGENWEAAARSCHIKATPRNLRIINASGDEVTAQYTQQTRAPRGTEASML